MIANFVKTSPRLVGQALKKNQLLSIPCHRVIASNFFIGGFRGEWGREGKEIENKIEKLEREGIFFDKRLFLNKEQREKCLFRDFYE